MSLRRLLFFVSIFALFSGIEASSSDYGPNSTYRRQAARIAASLDETTLAAQVLLTGIDGSASLTPGMRALLERIPVGGVMFFRFNLNTPKDDVKSFLSETAAAVTGRTGIPPFLAADHEGGLVHRFGPGIERLPSAYSFWELAQREGQAAALSWAETLYSRSAREIRELGITMVLAPVAETLNNDNHRFLETRSYGRDPNFTEAAASAYIKSMQAAGISCVVKHFPGNTASDPHTHSSILRVNRETLDEMARPFAGIIRNLSPPAIMLSHVIVPAMDNKNASLSRVVIEDWLRGELGFQGIAMADDFAMAAIAASGLSPSAAAVEALNSGIDMIMIWPRDMNSVHTAILAALRAGRLSRERLLEAAERIIAEKIRHGIISE